MKGYLTPGWVFQVPAIKANLFFPLVDSMIKKENDFINDNLVDVSGLVQLAVGMVSTPWRNPVCGNIREPGAGMLTMSVSKG